MPVVDNELKTKIMTQYIGVSTHNPVIENQIRVRTTDADAVNEAPGPKPPIVIEPAAAVVVPGASDTTEAMPQIEVPLYETLERKDIYLFDVKEYYYLTKDNMLFDFDEFIARQSRIVPFDPTLQSKILLCFFAITFDCGMPYVKILVDRTGDQFTLPSFSAFFSEFAQSQNVNELLEQKYTSAVMTLLNTSPEEMKTSIFYKGFLEENQTPVLFLDVTFFENMTQQINENRTWVILDEIVNEKKTLNNPIDTLVVHLFTNNHALLHIVEKETHENVPIPVCLYLLESENASNEEGGDTNDTDETNANIDTNDVTDLAKVNDTVYRNSLHSSEVETIMNPLLFDVPRIDHDVFGYHYYFTHQLSEEPSGNIKRFAVFIYDSLYILNTKTRLRHLKCIKNLREKRNTIQNLPDTPEPEQQQQQEPELEDDNDAIDETEEELFQNYSSILFFENNTRVWCIKTVERISEI